MASLAAKRTLILSEKNDPNLENYERIVDFGQHLQKEYPEFQKYRLYHFLVGSSPKEECVNFDFPDENSVEVFINKLYKEKFGEQKKDEV